MSDILALIDQLSQQISRSTTTETDQRWTTVEAIETDLSGSSHTTEQERETIALLKSAVSEGIARVRRGHHLQAHLIGMHLTSLRRSIERRTTGSDGWPLRQ